ncbi:RNA polymerase ECF-type sigma factor [hydrothermal vent metagenome]|uniref:RNA polymerase ECF-type sigma factor n=1 Tax=hydrothermal vent metagenome TaxID=652676 RepID=A0A3B1AEW2_9ZZZZ
MDMDAKQRTFESLVTAYAIDMYRYAYWLCHNSALAQDLVQEAFVRAWKALDSLDDHKAAKGWLFTIVRRENARYFDRKQNDDISLDDIEIDMIVGQTDDFASTENFVLRNALKALPKEYLEPLLLQVIGGYSCDEIATIMELNSGAVMTRLSRARKKMRELMTGDALAKDKRNSRK